MCHGKHTVELLSKIYTDVKVIVQQEVNIWLAVFSVYKEMKWTENFMGRVWTSYKFPLFLNGLIIYI